jgi:osmotically-inducible protein OsmY
MKNLSKFITATSLFTFSSLLQIQAADTLPANPASTSSTPANNVYTEPSNLSTQGKLNTDVNGQSNISLTDDSIAQKIRLTIRNDSKLSSNAKKAEVTVSKGNVTLKGFVANEEEKIKISALVRHVPGVKSISNNLSVSHSR